MRALRSSGGGGSRSAAGAYERPSRRGFGPLDPDEAWDARVGHEADGYGYGYEEQELGLRGQQPQRQPAQNNDTGYSGGYSNINLGLDERRGRTMNRDSDLGFGGSGGVGLGLNGAATNNNSHRNPFDDEAEPSNISLRGVSPRPIDTSVGGGRAVGKPKGVTRDSPTSERRSIFREEV